MASYFDQFRPEADSEAAETVGTNTGSYFDQFKPQPAPEPGRPEGGLLNDAAAAFGVGSNRLLQTLGSAYGLVTGDMDNWATQQGASGVEYFEDMKSEEYLANERKSAERIAQADGFLDELQAGAMAAIDNPMMLIEQIPNMLAPGGAGMAAARALGRTAGAVAGVAGGATLQASDIGSGTYEELMQRPPTEWEANDEYQSMTSDGVDPEVAKHQIALNLARTAASEAGVVSLASSRIPGARTIENAAARIPGAKGAVSRAAGGAIGEAAQEAIEEGSGQLFTNLNVGQVQTDRDLMGGVAAAAGQGAAAGGIFGAAGGAANTAAEPQAAIDDAEAEAAVAALQEEARARAADEDVAASQAAAEVEAAGGDALDATLAAQTAYNETATRRQLEEREQAAAVAELDRLQGRAEQGPIGTTMDQPIEPESLDANPITAAIDRARSRGDEEAVVRLENARRMDETAKRFEAEGRVEQAANFRQRSQAILQSVDRTTAVAPRESFVREGELQTAEQVTPAVAPREPETIDGTPALPPTTAPGQAAINVPKTTEQAARSERKRVADIAAREGVIQPGQPGRMQAPIVEETEAEVIDDASYPAPPAAEGETQAEIPQGADVRAPAGTGSVDANRSSASYDDQALTAARDRTKSADAAFEAADNAWQDNPTTASERDMLAASVERAKARVDAERIEYIRGRMRRGASQAEAEAAYEDFAGKVRKKAIDNPSGPAANAPIGKLAREERALAETGSDLDTDVEAGYVRFEEPTLGIPRQQMPQIKAGDRSALVQFLEARGVQNQRDTVSPDTLKPTQTNYSPAKVADQKNYSSKRAVLVSRDGRIVDGHHQWLAAREAGEDIDVIRLDTTAEDAISLAVDFPSSTTEAAMQAERDDEVLRSRPAQLTPIMQAAQANRELTEALKPLKDQRITEQVEDEDGNVVEISRSVDKEVRQMQKRLQVMDSLMECLG
jgi:hypothetical protein